METMATDPTILVNEVIDYTPLLEDIAGYASLSADASVWISGIAVFFMVVVICYFAYKFLRIFF